MAFVDKAIKTYGSKLEDFKKFETLYHKSGEANEDINNFWRRSALNAKVSLYLFGYVMVAVILPGKLSKAKFLTILFNIGFYVSLVNLLVLYVKDVIEITTTEEDLNSITLETVDWVEKKLGMQFEKIEPDEWLTYMKH